MVTVNCPVHAANNFNKDTWLSNVQNAGKPYSIKAFTVSDEVVYRFELRHKELFEDGKGDRVERTEASPISKGLFWGDKGWFTTKIRLDRSDWEKVLDHSVKVSPTIFQWKSGDCGDAGPLYIMFRPRHPLDNSAGSSNARIYGYYKDDKCDRQVKISQPIALKYDQNNQLTVCHQYGLGDEGALKVIVNGLKVVEYSGDYGAKTGQSKEGDRPKIGFYQMRWRNQGYTVPNLEGVAYVGYYTDPRWGKGWNESVCGEKPQARSLQLDNVPPEAKGFCSNALAQWKRGDTAGKWIDKAKGLGLDQYSCQRLLNR